MDHTPSRAIDVFRLLDERPMAALQAWVAILSALVMLVDGYDVQVLALAVPSIAGEWSIPPAHFGVALSAALFGIAVGAAFIAPLGDRVGRRTLLVGAMCLVGLTTVVTAGAASPAPFVFWRFLTGIGLGVSIPNCNAWTAEYTPLRSRATILVVMNASIGIGSFLAGIGAPLIFAHWGWRGGFLLGGAVSLGIALLIFAAAPESLKFLIVRRPQDPRIGSILARIAPEIGPAAPATLPASPARADRWLVAELLGPTYRRRTLVLWGVLVANLFTLFLLGSWLPTLLQQAGWAPDASLRGAAVIQAGGVVGGIVLSVFLSRGLTLPALLSAFVVSAACLILFRAATPLTSWVALALIGGGTNGTQLSLNALATAYYPPQIKATGMSWAGVVGNLSGLLGPLAGGWAIDRGIAAVNILALLSIPALCCALGVLLMRREWQWN